MKQQSKAFTLIELLVVVLVIGILAAVAVPQYQKAVEKSKGSEALTILKTIFTAAEMYYLDKGTWPTKFEQLDIEIPWIGNTPARTGTGVNIDVRSNENWSLQLINYPATNSYGVSIGRIVGPYAGAGFVMYHDTWMPTTNVSRSKIYCFEIIQAGIVFEKETGAYCTKLFGATHSINGGWIHAFTLPY